MISILYKWCFITFISLCFIPQGKHPIYVSVTEIENNSKNKTLEISCKIFTDDFEKTLRQVYHTHVDLLKLEDKTNMDNLVADYVKKHLKIIANGKECELKFIGYEQIEEGIYSYYEASNIDNLKRIDVTDNILYDYQAQQLSLLHITVNGNRKSTKLLNPEDKVSFDF